MEEELLSLLKTLKDTPYDEKYRIGRVCNALSMIKTVLGEGSWVGIYLFGVDKWVLGPFQGTPACERIPLGKGVVGHCGKVGIPVAVSDVSTFPGYICCDESAKSEICVPIEEEGVITAVFDIDLAYYHDFTEGEIALFKEIARELKRLKISAKA